MRWQDLKRSDQVEDRRGLGGGRGPVIGGVGILVVLLIGWIAGVDPMALLEQVNGGDPGAVPSASAPAGGPAANDPARDFVAAILGSTEDVWTAMFSATGQQYPKPKLVLFSGSTPSACGMSSAAMGPFYCPGDHAVYIDLSFYEDLKSRFRAPGDFAQAYVIAHEVGHHVQTLLGTTDRVSRLRGQQSEGAANATSVRLELQADCYAGVWAHNAEQQKAVLEAGDIEEALTAASAIGDDRLQRQSRGVVVPESFTHGTSEQRVRWFKRGFDSGSLNQCDTFSAPSP